MKTFEEFCNSNILQVILKNHNEGGSRDVERLTRKAYDEYIKYPHLRHIEGHQLREITFFPPKLSTEEQRLCRLNGVEECHVDLYSLDNWCAWGEWYLLLKLKRTDNRDNVAIANSAMYLKNLPIVALKYCRNKLRDEKEQRLEDERAKLEKQARAKLEEQAGTSRKSIITDFFKAKTSKSPRKKKKMESKDPLLLLLPHFINLHSTYFQCSGCSTLRIKIDSPTARVLLQKSCSSPKSPLCLITSSVNLGQRRRRSS